MIHRCPTPSPVIRSNQFHILDDPFYEVVSSSPLCHISGGGSVGIEIVVLRNPEVDWLIETSPSWYKLMQKVAEKHGFQWGQTAKVCPETASGRPATAKDRCFCAHWSSHLGKRAGNEQIVDNSKRLLYYDVERDKSCSSNFYLGNLGSNVNPGRFDHLGAGAGKTGIAYSFQVLLNRAYVELYIDCDKDSGELNESIFDNLLLQKDAIEEVFGERLEWDRLDNRRASRIRKTIDQDGLATPENWQPLQENTVDAMVRLEKALRQPLSKLP